jgi:signal transduction histidine kinase
MGHDENVELVFNSLDHNVVFVEADKARISQVISNLLNNAIKFTKKGMVFIGIQEENKQESLQKFVVTVRDTGTGIDSEILPRLFEKFASKSCKGTGLGLLGYLLHIFFALQRLKDPITYLLSNRSSFRMLSYF